MGIFLRQSHNIKPPRWGSPADVQYSIKRNMESIYMCNPGDEVLIMPLFWGLPCLDFSGNNNHGTNHGATYKAGSLDFDGGDDYVGIDGTNFITSPSAITVSVWARPNSLTVDQRLITRFGLDIQFVLWMDQGGTGEGWAWAVRDSSSSQINLGENNADAVTTRLQHIVGTVESGGNSKIYVDGQETGTVNFANPIQTSAIDIWIGAMDLSTDQFFNGIIDEVRISKAARTAETIGIFYERPWDLYRRVARVFYSLPAAPSAFIPQIIMF